MGFGFGFGFGFGLGLGLGCLVELPPPLLCGDVRHRLGREVAAAVLPARVVRRERPHAACSLPREWVRARVRVQAGLG